MAPAAEALSTWRLVGIAGRAGRRVALLRPPGFEETVTAGTGDRVLGWSIAAIVPDFVLLRDPQTGRTLRLRPGA